MCALNTNFMNYQNVMPVQAYKLDVTGSTTFLRKEYSWFILIFVCTHHVKYFTITVFYKQNKKNKKKEKKPVSEISYKPGGCLLIKRQ